jgi:hypothetical protein
MHYICRCCLYFCPFSFGKYIICRLLLWLPLWYLQTFLNSNSRNLGLSISDQGQFNVVHYNCCQYLLTIIPHSYKIKNLDMQIIKIRPSDIFFVVKCHVGTDKIVTCAKKYRIQVSNVRKVWRYQRGNQNRSRQIIYLPNEKGQKYKQHLQNTTQKINKILNNMNPAKSWRWTQVFRNDRQFLLH